MSRLVLGVTCGVVWGALRGLHDPPQFSAYAPILILGAIGGTAIGWIVEKFGR